MELALQRLTGFTAPNNGSLAHHPANLICYVAGCTVVLYDCKSRAQLRYYKSKAGKPFSCTAISRLGKGHFPCTLSCTRWKSFPHPTPQASLKISPNIATRAKSSAQ